MVADQSDIRRCTETGLGQARPGHTRHGVDTRASARTTKRWRSGAYMPQTKPFAWRSSRRIESMRELYEQFIAYARAYSDAVPDYTASDNSLAAVAITASTVLVTTCSAIVYGSAPARGPLVAPAPQSNVAVLTDPSESRPFLQASDPTCAEWDGVINQFAQETQPWQGLNPNDPASTWTPQQRAAAESVVPVMNDSADNIEELGSRSSSPILQDFANYAAQYRRAYAASLPTYAPADFYLADTALRTTSLINEACSAVED